MSKWESNTMQIRSSPFNGYILVYNLTIYESEN